MFPVMQSVLFLKANMRSEGGIFLLIKKFEQAIGKARSQSTAAMEETKTDRETDG